MNLQQLKKFCHALKIPISEAGETGWSKLTCPLAPWRHQTGHDKNPSFGVELHRNKASDCHCFSCNWSGDPITLVMEIKRLSGNDRLYDFKTAMDIAVKEDEGMSIGLYDSDEVAHTNAVHYFDEKWLSTFARAVDIEDAVNYCTTRRVPRWLMEELDLRYDSSERRVCFPVRDFEKRLVGLHGRAIDKENTPPYKMYTYKGNNNPQFWYGEDRLDLDKPIVAVESVFDFAATFQAYRNVTCPLTASMNGEKLDRLRDALFIVRFFDNDKAGQAASTALRNYLRHVPSVNVLPPEGSDPGAMSIALIRQVLSKHVQSVLTRSE